LREPGLEEVGAHFQRARTAQRLDGGDAFALSFAEHQAARLFAVGWQPAIGR
jgi:hypothetical protein